MANEPKTKREELQQLLENIRGVKAAYYVKPPSKDMEFPCIVYAIERLYSDMANDARYGKQVKYEVTHITKNVLDQIEDEFLLLPYSSFESRFIVDNLVHTKFGLYF